MTRWSPPNNAPSQNRSTSRQLRSRWPSPVRDPSVLSREVPDLTRALATPHLLDANCTPKMMRGCREHGRSPVASLASTTRLTLKAQSATRRPISEMGFELSCFILESRGQTDEHVGLMTPLTEAPLQR